MIDCKGKRLEVWDCNCECDFCEKEMEIDFSILDYEEEFLESTYY